MKTQLNPEKLILNGSYHPPLLFTPDIWAEKTKRCYCVRIFHPAVLFQSYQIAMNKKGHQALSTCGETNKQMRPFCFSSSADELKRAETHSRV